MELQHCAMQKLIEQNQVVIHKSIADAMAPMMEMLTMFKADAVKKEDLRNFKDEVRQEVKMMIDASFAKDAVAQ